MSERLTLDPTLDPWERQPSESPKRYARFLGFRDLGLTRTLAKAADDLALNYSYVRSAAATYRWQERAGAWDAHQQQEYAAELEEERRKAARDDAKILRIMTGMIGQALPFVQQQASEMTVAEFTRFVETTMRLRRNLFGDPTDTVAVTGAGGDPLTVQLTEFSELAPEQRRVRLAELAATVARRVHATDGDDDDDEEVLDAPQLPGRPAGPVDEENLDDDSAGTVGGDGGEDE